MIRILTAALIALGLAAPIYGSDLADTLVKKGNKPAAVTAKTLKNLAKEQKPAPLAARLESVNPPDITVKTRPITGPDGIIPSQEKTYDTTNATVVKIKKQTKTLADLLPGEKLKLKLSNDGKTADVIRVVEKTAKKKA